MHLTSGELTLVLFIFGLTWGAGLLPRVGEWLGERTGKGGASPGAGG